MSGTISSDVLNLRVGDWVEVKRPDEILKTLDPVGNLECLPFMPEMVRFCGRRFRVLKRIDKTCDTIDKTGMRRMKHTVILDDVRCDGQSHGGCQAACMIFWKEAWLKRVPSDVRTGTELYAINGSVRTQSDTAAACDNSNFLAALERSSRAESAPPGENIFVCQVTELKKATCRLLWWDPWQYWRDIRSRNVRLWRAIRGILIMLFNLAQSLRGGCSYPYMPPRTNKKTPHESLNLASGELVKVKSKEEILQTLDANYKNRGLWYDMEMLPFCGKTFRVIGRVDQLLNERTGKMMKLSNECIILQGVTCNGEYHQFCPRSEYIYWREIWLQRVSDTSDNFRSAPSGHACAIPCKSAEVKS